MASVKRRPDTGKWRARYRDEAGKEHAKHFDRKVDAQRWLDEVTTSVLTGQYVDPRAGRILLGPYAEAWLAMQVTREATRRAYSSHLRVHVLPRFSERPMASIKPSEIQQWVTELSATLAPRTVKSTFEVLKSIFRAAELDRVIARTPCDRIALPKLVRKQVTPLPTEMVLGIEAGMPPRWSALVTLMAGTGLRSSEAVGLTVDRIDFLRRSIRIDRQLTINRPYKFAPPKTRASVRTVPLPQVVVDALAAHIAAFPPGDHGLLFTNEAGKPPNRDEISRCFKRAALAVGAPQETRPHDLRHYYASLLIRSGASVKVVQARLGHGSAVETLDTYSHMWPDSEDQTRDAVDAVLGAAADHSRTEESS